jgi:hypothetical protein
MQSAMSLIVGGRTPVGGYRRSCGFATSGMKSVPQVRAKADHASDAMFTHSNLSAFECRSCLRLLEARPAP